MAQKRTAKEAFGRPKGQLSAVAAAKLAKQKSLAVVEAPVVQDTPEDLATVVGTEEYDGHHDSRSSTPPLAEDETPPATSPRRTDVRLSSAARNQVHALASGEGLEAELKFNDTLTCVGEYDLTVTTGIVTIYGSVLRPESGTKRVYAASTQALPQIQGRQDGTTLRISQVNSSLRKLEKLAPSFRNIWSGDGASFTLLRSSGVDALQRSLSVLEIEKEMDVVLRTLSAKVMVEPRKPRIMAVGAKSSGKSTFNRVLCNHIISWTPAAKCQYLDLDPGQPEFGPPGQVSLVEVTAPLLGPSFTHFASAESSALRMIRSHTIAATSFKHDPDHYRACALDLIRRVDRSLPLVVNACGWVNGLGASVLTELVSLLDITDLVLLEPLDADFREPLQSTSRDFAVHKLPRQAPKPSPRTPAEQRAMQTMAYFHHRATSTAILRFSGKPISRFRPFNVSYAARDQSIVAVASYGQAPKPEFLAEVLEGSIVAITVLDRDYASELRETIGATVPDGIPYLLPQTDGMNRTLNPQHSHCIGLALVRAIDLETQQFQLATPLAEHEVAGLAEKDVVLVRGSFDPPEWAYLEDLYLGGESEDRPWVSRREMVGIEGAVWRLRHPPMAASGR